jgi:hypothetical protein
MTEKLATKLKIESWDEQPYQELPNGSKFTRATVVLKGDALAGTWNALMYYRPDGTGTYVGLMHLTGSLGDRTGGVTLRSTGTFDGTTARVDSDVVPGSGVDGFDEMSGTSTSVSTHDDYPFWPMTLEYDIP